MKKFGMIAMALILTLSLCACGGRNNNDATTPTTQTTTTRPTTTPTTAPTTPPTTAPTVMPDLPDMDTNIPDPSVDSNSTNGMTDDANSGDLSRGRNYRK